MHSVLRTFFFLLFVVHLIINLNIEHESCACVCVSQCVLSLCFCGIVANEFASYWPHRGKKKLTNYECDSFFLFFLIFVCFWCKICEDEMTTTAAATFDK